MLATATALSFSRILFTTFVAVLILKEVVSGRRWTATGLGFVGVVVIMRPGAGAFNPVLLIALLSAALMGVAKVSIRKMADTEPPRRIVFWFGAFSTLISAVPLLWVDIWPSTTQFGWMLAIGLVATIAQICMTTAYQLASPGKVGVYNYTAVIWAASLGWLIWGERLHWTFLIGTLLIVSSGIWNLKKPRPV